MASTPATWGNDIDVPAPASESSPGGLPPLEGLGEAGVGDVPARICRPMTTGSICHGAEVVEN